ncbi:hypothetical protein LOTGIDRAFT_171849 [Lottia gigantea]|uniref:G-protein coupled receptors family 1 profile domain-containing protein n=1 Tax=Lottia gigantea TaxID=225164 RepID=V4AF34_LOTGI|nr:hypothetical protein LOTGIDRAFT_171849 [Lottia gigantea]ESP02649.1 hypothetical protein LOTGIDRAFT_171849 [Lottia gigantea]
MTDINECDHVLFTDGKNHSIAEVRSQLIELENHEALMKLPAIIFIGVLLLVGLVGNFLVCIVYHLKFPPSTSKYFIMALAVFDLLNCTIAIPAEMVDLRFDFHFNSPYVCRIMRFTISFSTAASACTLLAIATDRYRKICHPFGRQMNSKQTKLGIILAIIGALAVSWPATILYGRSTSIMEGLRVADCAFDDDMINTPYPQIYISVLTAMCLTSVLTLIVLYTLIVMRVWKQKRARGRFQSPVSNGPQEPRCSNFRFNCFEGLENRSESVESDIFSATQDQNDSTEKRKTHSYSVRTTVMLALVTAVFILSFIPFFVLQILKNAIPNFERNLHCNHPAMVSYKFFLRSIFLNSAANPIIYSFCNRQFRTECRDFLGRVCCSRPSDCSRPSSSDEPIEIPEAEKADPKVL